MNMKVIVLALAGIFLSHASYAATAGWTEQTKITSMFVYDEENLLLSLENYNNLAECGVNGGPVAGHVILNPTTQRTMLAMLLTAFAASKDVKFYINEGCVPIWSGANYGEILHVQIL
ncbi:hypothetical protein ACU6U9_01765 [Pseudomonas sp. HK3]